MQGASVVARAGTGATLWEAVTPAEPALATLDGALSTDCVVIGAGVTGLSAALQLRAAGVDVIVLEALEPGAGASGRNNGQVIPTLSRPDPDDIERRYGTVGERLVLLIRDSAGLLFDLVRQHAIAAEAEQTGWVQPAHTPGRLKISERRVEQWSRRGAPVALLSREEVRQMLGSDAWHGGFWNRTGGHVNPLALTRGLAGAALKQGVRVFSKTPADRFAHDGRRWVVHTPRGQVAARALILATNAYTGEIRPALAPAIAREVVPVRSWQMATTPVDPAIAATIIPGRQAMSDTHGDLHFARWDARGRLVTGGALIVAAGGAERLKARIGRRIAGWFPALRGIGFDYVWNGYVGMTIDFLPRVHRLGPDGFAWVGCNGRALGLAAALGRELADAVSGRRPLAELALPLSEPRPLPAHGLIRRVAPLRLASYRWNDAREIG
jgi:glycine/D-amino acid oxidase-like deaminating enzyme